jgi:hypothetical protein
VGIYGVRPAVLFGDPALEKYAPVADEAIAAALKQMGAPGSFPRVEELEQVCGIVTLYHNERAKVGPRHALMLSLQTIRATHPHDWKAFIDAVAPTRKEVSFQGRVYYHVRRGDILKSSFPGVIRMISGQDMLLNGMCFYLPDRRTLVLGSEEQVRQMIRRGGAEAPAWARAAGWEKVARGVVAVALNNRDEHMANVWQAAGKESWWPALPGLHVVSDRASAFVFGAELDGGVRLDALAACAGEGDARAVANAALDLLSLGQTALHTRLDEAGADADPSLAVMKALLNGTRVEVERDQGADVGGAVAHARCRARRTLADVVDLLRRLEAAGAGEEGK